MKVEVEIKTFDFQLKISLAFAVFHGGFAAFVVVAVASFGLGGGGYFLDDLFHG
ncbi:MAG: hypothetical protein WD491_07905 [Balneolales bacterium]